MENERDQLYDGFANAVEEVKQKCGLKNALLERRMMALDEELEKARLLRLSEADGAEDEGMNVKVLEVRSHFSSRP